MPASLQMMVQETTPNNDIERPPPANVQTTATNTPQTQPGDLHHQFSSVTEFMFHAVFSLMRKIMTAALTRGSQYVETFQFSAGGQRTVRVSYIYIHTYIIIIYSGLMSLRTAKPLETWGKKCLVGREGKLKRVCLQTAGENRRRGSRGVSDVVLISGGRLFHAIEPPAVKLCVYLIMIRNVHSVPKSGTLVLLCDNFSEST